MPTALIAYSTRTGETRNIAELIAEGLRFAAVTVTLKGVVDIRRETELADFDIYVFGSSTYHGTMMDRMKTFLFLAERADLKGKVGGAFGAYGWSGEAAERIFETMQNIYGMEMAGGPLMLKSAAVDGGITAAQAYGRELAARVG